MTGSPSLGLRTVTARGAILSKYIVLSAEIDTVLSFPERSVTREAGRETLTISHDASPPVILYSYKTPLFKDTSTKLAVGVDGLLILTSKSEISKVVISIGSENSIDHISGYTFVGSDCP